MRGSPPKGDTAVNTARLCKKEKEKLLKELHSDPLWKGIGLLNLEEEDLSERDDWGVVELESE